VAQQKIVSATYIYLNFPKIMLEFLAILSDVLGIHGWFTGIRQGKLQDQMLDEILRVGTKVEQLSEHILYASSIHQVRDITKTNQEQLFDKRQIREFLDPIQRSIRNDVLATAIISTPERIRYAFRKNPREVLFSISPLDKVEIPDNPDAVPILFSDQGFYHVGWQMKGALPSLLNCEYDSTKGLYTISNLHASIEPMHDRHVDGIPSHQNGHKNISPLAVVTPSPSYLSSESESFLTTSKEKQVKQASSFRRILGGGLVGGFMGGFLGGFVACLAMAILLGLVKIFSLGPDPSKFHYFAAILGAVSGGANLGVNSEKSFLWITCGAIGGAITNLIMVTYFTSINEELEILLILAMPSSIVGTIYGCIESEEVLKDYMEDRW
jgi:hypothetical protein